ncbi:mannonate dehydratase [Roseobacter weihaiensis]|uniref:mannonate dehydratase n=1 Tax=Roseobacter weihaiensis TaxID=2763262 RepID=UPI001D09E848|nr:mannonate dehydratase [Roseobacter sp. H9]
MKQCWRWFGPADTIALPALHQVGVESIVSALHHIPPGQVWTEKDIRDRMEILEAAGFSWEVAESLPVSETIKTQGAMYAEHLDAYRESLRNLVKCGVVTVCYNFMPILDWTRTELRARQAHGGTAMRFRLMDFAVFDLHILGRHGASDDYTPELLETAKARFNQMSDTTRAELQRNIVAGLPGANDNWTVDDVRAHLATYTAIDADRLRRNLIDFLSEICPLAEELGLRMCCHPDDPPFSLLGLPRIMSSTQDYATILTEVNTPANGATLCTGSLGVAKGFDPVEFISRLGDRIHFVHLRNTKRLAGGDPARPDFFEAAHLEGDTDMVATIRALMAEQARRKSVGRADWQIPMRPDHGQELLSDLDAGSMPGYPLIGRMRGLAELRGVMAACAG